jgi:hypothetical protein
MSDKTLFNQDLTLNSLTISNSTDSDASGYVPASTVVNPTSIYSNVITTTEVAFTGSGSTSTPYITTNAGNGFVLSSASGTGVTLSTPAGGVDLIATAPNVLAVDGTINSTALGIINGANVVGLSCPSPATLEVSGTIITTEVDFTGNGSTSSTYINTNAGNGLVVSTESGAGITLSTPAGGVSFQATAPNVLAVNGTTNSQAFGIVNGANTVGLLCPAPATLQVGGRIIANNIYGAIQAPPSPGAWNVSAGSQATITLAPFTWNTVLTGQTFFSFTINCSNNIPSLVSSYIPTQVGSTVDITLNLYNVNSSAGSAIASIEIFGYNP